MILKKKNLNQIIRNNLEQQTPPNSDERDQDLEATLPLSEWIKNLPKNPSPVPKHFPTIYSLNLSKTLLMQFPHEILKLSSLKFLILDENFINFIPKTIVNLKNLEMLSISNNRLDVIGSWVSKFAHLTYLNLSKNNISVLIEDLRYLKSLETLLIQENRFEKLPLFLHELPNLREFGLDWFLFLSPSLEKNVVQKDKDPVFNQMMFFMRGRVQDLSFSDFLNGFSEKKNYKMDPILKLLNRPCLQKCIGNNNLGVLSVILKKTPHLLNEINDDGYSLLSYAIFQKNPFVPEILLGMDCNLTQGFRNYNSALNFAISMLCEDLSIELLKKGLSPNILDSDGNSALHILFDGRFNRIPKAKEICNLILEKGVQTNLENKSKLTAIHLAIKTEQAQAIEWALKYNQRRRKKKQDLSNLFDFDKKFGAFSFTAAHYASFLGKVEILEIMAKYPEEIDLFERCKTGKTPMQVAYKGVSLLKVCVKCEKKWIKSMIIDKLAPKSNINKIPEGIMVNQILENKKTGFERPKAKSMFNRNPKSVQSPSDKEFEEMNESPLCFGTKNVFDVLTKEKAPNDIGLINQRLTDVNELEECLKIQNEILLKIQGKSIENEELELILKNLFGFLANPEITFSEKIMIFFLLRLFQFKINLWTQKFSCKILPYSIFLINTFFNSPLKPALFQKRLQTLQCYLKKHLEEEMAGLEKKENSEREGYETQLLISEFIRCYFDASQNCSDRGFSYLKFWKTSNPLIVNYEIFNAHHYMNFLRNAIILSKKASTKASEKIKNAAEIEAIKASLQVEKKHQKSPSKNTQASKMQLQINNSNLQNIQIGGKKNGAGALKMPFAPNEEEFTIIETTRRCSLKAYYFPSKQEISPFQTKEKGGLNKKL